MKKNKPAVGNQHRRKPAVSRLSSIGLEILDWQDFDGFLDQCAALDDRARREYVTKFVFDQENRDKIQDYKRLAEITTHMLRDIARGIYHHNAKLYDHLTVENGGTIYYLPGDHCWCTGSEVEVKRLDDTGLRRAKKQAEYRGKYFDPNER